MRIKSSVKSKDDRSLKQTKVTASYSQNPNGFLAAVENPSPALASAAQSTLGLPYKPSSLIVGIPTTSMPDPLEKTLKEISLKVIKNVSKQISNSSGIPILKSGIDVAWYLYDAQKLFKEWQDPNKNIPALIIDTTKLTLDTLASTIDMTNSDYSLFANESLNDNLDLVFAGLNAAANQEDVGMAILNEKVNATEIGKVLGHFTPIINSALSEDPNFKDVKLKPLPQFKLYPNLLGRYNNIPGSSFLNIGMPLQTEVK